MAFCSAHGEEVIAFQLEDLSTHQVQDMRANAVYLAAVPVFHRISFQCVVAVSYTHLIDRALETYLKKGYSREWINQRLQAIQVRKELTDEWDARGVQKGVEYAILTDEISRAWSGMSTRQYKNLKGLKKENLRDNMTTLELVLNMLAEATTTEISKQKAPSTFSENMAVAREGGEAAGIARKAVEERTGVPVITPKNAAQLNQVVTDLLEGAVSDTKEKPKDK